MSYRSRFERKPRASGGYRMQAADTVSRAFSRNIETTVLITIASNWKSVTRYRIYRNSRLIERSPLGPGVPEGKLRCKFWRPTWGPRRVTVKLIKWRIGEQAVVDEILYYRKFRIAISLCVTFLPLTFVLSIVLIPTDDSELPRPWNSGAYSTHACCVRLTIACVIFTYGSQGFLCTACGKIVTAYV